MLSIKLEGIKYYFFSRWYDSTWAIGEYSNHKAKTLILLVFCSVNTHMGY